MAAGIFTYPYNRAIKYLAKRKSCCVSARGIPQVLALLLCLHPVLMGGRGYPIQSRWRRYLHPILMGGTPIQSRQEGDTTLPPNWPDGGTPCQPDGGTPHPDLGRGYPPRQPDGRTPPPPLSVDGQTPVKTLPSHSFRIRAVKSQTNTPNPGRCHCLRNTRQSLKDTAEAGCWCPLPSTDSSFHDSLFSVAPSEE